MQVTATKSSASFRFLELAGTPPTHSQLLLMSTQRNNNCFDSKVHVMLAISIRFRSRIKKAHSHYPLEQLNPRVWGQIFSECLVNWEPDGGLFFVAFITLKRCSTFSAPQDIKNPRNIVIKNGCARVRDGDYRLGDNFKLETCPSSGHFLARLITSGAITKENFSEAGRQKVQRSVFKVKCCGFFFRLPSKGSWATWRICFLFFCERNGCDPRTTGY